MAGTGFAPGPKERLVNPNRDKTPTKTIRFEPSQQPVLPEGPEYPEWHPQTRKWWAMWGASPQAEHFMATDWDFMLETAIMHSAFWAGDHWALASEIRLRVSKFGATPEDRARLRMVFADADEKDAKRPATTTSAHERRGSLHALSPKTG